MSYCKFGDGPFFREFWDSPLIRKKEPTFNFKERGKYKMSEKELIEKIEKLEKRVAELEKEVGYIKEDIYEFVEEDDEECSGHCGHCGGCGEE